MPSGVVVQSYDYQSDNASSLIDPLEWPSGSFIVSVLESEHQLDSLVQIDARCKDPHHWQALARRALLQKYGYDLPISQRTEEIAITTVSSQEAALIPDDLESIHSVWTQVVRDCMGTTNSSPADNVLRGGLHENDNTKSRDDLLEFLASRCTTSNQRPLQWSFMTIPAGLRFPLHAHPNIELVFCCTGALHEIRMDGTPLPPDNSMRPDETHTTLDPSFQGPPILAGPTLTNSQRSWTFGTLSAGQWLVNDVWSIHQSFTATNSRTPCRLLVLWGGSHADIVHPPTNVNVLDAVHTMDQRLCACAGSSTDYTEIAETFLPASEKSAATLDASPH